MEAVLILFSGEKKHALYQNGHIIYAKRQHDVRHNSSHVGLWHYHHHRKRLIEKVKRLLRRSIPFNEKIQWGLKNDEAMINQALFLGVRLAALFQELTKTRSICH